MYQVKPNLNNVNDDDDDDTADVGLQHYGLGPPWTAELAAGLCFVVSATGFEPTRVDSTGFETLLLNPFTPG